MKRSRHPSTSDESDNGSKYNVYFLLLNHPLHSKCRSSSSNVFRTDLITAMKVHDSHSLNPEDYYILADQWRQEWEKGVQVPVSPQSIPQPVTRVLAEKGSEVMFVRPKKLIRTSGAEALGYVDIRTLAEGMCRYDLDKEDVAWLQIINREFTSMAMVQLDEMTMEKLMEEFEHRCYENMTHAMETEEGLGIEYDEDVVCDVCQSPDGEDNNEMVFCDKCNICVHQACYGIQKVPTGSWLCRICALGILPKCQLCPKKGGAMKPTRSGTKWVHVSCALWIPEVSIANPEKMEPITNVSHIPSNRWALICCLCKEKAGACIQCSAKNCRTAFHVTCGLHAKLEMNTILTEDDEVKFKSFCPQHSGLEGALAGVNLRKLKLQEMEEEFYQFVEVDEVAAHLKLPPEMVDFLYQYWKLKRKANFNQPLLTPKKDEEESLARREHEVLLRRLQLFTHLRQDLERVRNLTYMVTRREKMKRSLCRVQEQIFHHQVRLLDQELLDQELLDQGLLTGSPLLKDSESLLSSGSFSSQDSNSGSSWTQSGSKSSSASIKQRKNKSRDKKSLCDFPRTSHKKENLSKPLENKDSKNYCVKECTDDAGVQSLENPASLAFTTNSKFNKGSLSSGNTDTKANIWMKKSQASDRTLGGTVRGWGKFRIPKRMERPLTVRGREEELQKPLLRPLINTPVTSQLRTRLRDGFTSDPRPTDGEVERCSKRYHSHQLRGDTSLSRRYNSDIIRRGVLAS
uniref:Protein Jade-1 n=1 Tax=Cynoglossus semilaevis TaxID=244447 RepID=A0A3P8W3L9_CYNSE